MVEGTKMNWIRALFVFQWMKLNSSTSTNEKKEKELTNVKNNDQEHNDEEANETRQIKKVQMIAAMNWMRLRFIIQINVLKIK